MGTYFIISIVAEIIKSASIEEAVSAFREKFNKNEVTWNIQSYNLNFKD
jgi:hypothetical protein